MLIIHKIVVAFEFPDCTVITSDSGYVKILTNHSAGYAIVDRWEVDNMENVVVIIYATIDNKPCTIFYTDENNITIQGYISGKLHKNEFDMLVYPLRFIAN